MERAFIKGYQQMTDRINVHIPMTIRIFREPKLYLQDIFEEQANWKSNSGYHKPDIVFERDSVIPPLLFFIVLIFSFKMDMHSLIYALVVLLLGIAAVCAFNYKRVFSVGRAALVSFKVGFAQKKN